MAAGITFKPKRKAGAFSGGELAAGEVGLDTLRRCWYYSADGSTVVTLGMGPAQSVRRASGQTVGASTTPESVVWDGSKVLSLAPNRAYKFSTNAGVTSVGSGNGARIRLSTDTAVISYMSVLVMLDPTTAATGNRLITALDTDVIQTAAIGSTVQPVSLDGQIHTGSTGGELRVQFAGELSTGGFSVTMEGPILASLIDLGPI